MTKNPTHVKFYGRKSSQLSANGVAMTNEANQTERDLNNQLLIIGVAFIGVAGAILASGIFSESSTTAQALATLFTVLFSLLSLASGLTHYFKDIKFLRDSSRNYVVLSNLYEEAELAAINDDEKKHLTIVPKIKELSDSFGDSTSSKLLIAELVCLTASAVSLLALISAIVWDWGNAFALS